MMKKLLCLFGLYFLLTGYVFPSDSPYIIINSNRGNNEKLYFAENMVQYIHINGNSVIGSYSNNVVAYTSSGNIYYFPLYDTPYYRDGYTSYPLNITKVVEVNLYPTERSIINKNYELYLITLLGGIVVICFIKK